jgi:hypothetical protein
MFILKITKCLEKLLNEVALGVGGRKPAFKSNPSKVL